MKHFYKKFSCPYSDPQLSLQSTIKLSFQPAHTVDIKVIKLLLNGQIAHKCYDYTVY